MTMNSKINRRRPGNREHQRGNRTRRKEKGCHSQVGKMILDSVEQELADGLATRKGVKEKTKVFPDLRSSHVRGGHFQRLNIDRSGKVCGNQIENIGGKIGKKGKR